MRPRRYALVPCRQLLATFLPLVLAFAACDRNPPPAPRDSTLPTKDQAPSDLGSDVSAPPPDMLPDTLSPDLGKCPGGCLARCQLVYGCKLYPKLPKDCLDECAKSWTLGMTTCLDGLVCQAKPDCAAAEQCIVGPPTRADLGIKGAKATVNGNVVAYTFEVCNFGDGDAGEGFRVALFYDAPQPNKPDWTFALPAGLPAGSCQAVKHLRQQTPMGTYGSWIVADDEDRIVEWSETNNAAGPIGVLVGPPPQPDLVVKTFDATVNGSDIDYSIEVCNQGKANAGFFRLDLFYTGVIAPIGVLGDQSVNFFLGLAAGACQTVKPSYKNAPVGVYNSWVKLDALNAVPESNEGNNGAGPKLITVAAQSGCIAFCTFATGCGEFSVTGFNQCLSWCSGMNTTERSCADAAATATDCAALKACTLPTKPPPPAPPWACINLCSYLVDTCKLIPSNQNLTCIGGCLTLPQTKRQCAVDAQNNKQCTLMLTCLL